MASTNLNFKMGLQPQYGAHDAAVPTRRLPTRLGIQSATQAATKIYRGQPAYLAATGWLKPVASAADLTAAGGVWVAAEPFWGSNSTQTDLAVWRLQRGQGFMLQLNNTGNVNISSLLQWNINLTGFTGGDTNSGISTIQGNAASASSASEEFRVVDILSPAGGKKLGPYAKVVVEPNWGGTAIVEWSEESTAHT